VLCPILIPNTYRGFSTYPAMLPLLAVQSIFFLSFFLSFSPPLLISVLILFCIFHVSNFQLFLNLGTGSGGGLK
jgi:hypothetical protein